MSKFTKISVIGSGSWGTAVADLFAREGGEVQLWGRDVNLLNDIGSKNENTKYLKGHTLSKNIVPQESLEKAIDSAELVVCGIPTQNIRKVFSDHKDRLSEKTVMSTSKGIEQGTDLRVSQIFADINPKTKFAVLSGPNFAKEVVKGLPAASTVASENLEEAEKIQRSLSGDTFRVYTADDVCGVELGGALKNVVALATGIADGLGLGANAQAALINRGLNEIARAGNKLGAKKFTFLGLAGMGDLVLTCTGPLSRNRTMGVHIGKGLTIDEARESLGGVAEGYYTAKSAFEIVEKNEIDAPIIREIYRILYEGLKPTEALKSLMSRELKAEWE